MFWLLKDGCQLRSSSIISLDQYIIFQPTQFWIPESRWCDLAGICQGTSFSISQHPSIVIKYLENFILKAKMSKTKGMSCEFFLFISVSKIMILFSSTCMPAYFYFLAEYKSALCSRWHSLAYCFSAAFVGSSMHHPAF